MLYGKGPGNLAFFNRWRPQSSSPQMPLEYIEIISAAFAGQGDFAGGPFRRKMKTEN
jgi:hypothetical protein